MKMSVRNYLVIIVCLFLTGCASSSVNNAVAQQKSAEDFGWAQVDGAAEKECGVDPSLEKLPPRNKAVQQTKCVTGLVNQYVLPNAVFPDLVNDLRDKAEFLSGQYADGKLSENERLYAGKQAWQEYIDKAQARINEMFYAEQQHNSTYNDAVLGALSKYGQARQQRADPAQINCMSGGAGTGIIYTRCQ